MTHVAQQSGDVHVLYRLYVRIQVLDVKLTDAATLFPIWYNNHHPLFVSLCLQPDELTNALEISNIVFTSLFSLEMLLKVLVYGPFGYIKNPYNIFDGIIVVIR